MSRRAAERDGTRGEVPDGPSLEFPPGAADPPASVSRRDFMALLSAGAALAAGACMRRPDKTILPYVDTPPDIVPGNPLYYATAMPLDGYATGVLVRSHTGRPTKIEGNPDHPASLGAAGAFEQASLLELYDPHRSRAMRAGRRGTTWGAFKAAFAPPMLSRRVGARGAGLGVLMPPTTSPLVGLLLGRLREVYPEARTFFYAPLESPARITAARSSLGAALVPQYDFRAADVVVALDADILAEGPFHLRYAREWADRRRAAPSTQLHVAEATPSPTGTLAARRLGATWSTMGSIAAALLDALGRDARRIGRVRDGFDAFQAPGGALTPDARAWVAAVATELAAHAGRSIVVCGPRQAPEVHLVVSALNDSLGNVGATVWYTPPAVLGDGGPDHDLGALATDLRNGAVDTLVVLEGNPCYTAPSDVELSRLVAAVPNTVYLGAYDDETAAVSSWHLPAAHYLESWGDARAYDGTASLIQPLIAPLHDGHTAAEVLAVVSGQPNDSAHDLLRDEWNRVHGPALRAEGDWNDALRRGVVADSAFPRSTPAMRWDVVTQATTTLAARNVPRDRIEIAFVPSRTVHDGRFADNGWLQELPDPITKLTWDNAVLVAPALAARLGVASSDVITLRVGERILEAPVLVVPGHADGAITLAMGYGRRGAEAVARGVGVNANVLRTSAEPHASASVAVTPTGRRHELAITQAHWAIEGRGSSIIGVDGERAGASAVQPRKRRPLTLYEPRPPSGDGFGADQWAMVIDLDVCTGCSACVVACQAENNVPVVGRDGVLKSREMHWLRVDRYVDGPADDPRFATQPMLCQHCEKAPCEYVCPVNATVHSEDGLNEMVYNRCVGTRFCSNNCPYKVRRFNWFDYNGEIAETERMAKNPEVTIRARGVMEKCTFCVQRIRDAQMASRIAGDPATRPVVTACQQSCPTQAIVFGSLTDPESEVARQFVDPRSFSALEELGTVPRVRYLASRKGRDGTDGSGGRAR